MSQPSESRRILPDGVFGSHRRSGASSRPGVTGCGNASASRRPRSPWHGSWRSSCIACGAMEPTSSGQPRRRRLRSNNPPEFRESGTDVPVGTAASARSIQALRCLERGKHDSHIDPPTSSDAIMQRARAPTTERTVNPAGASRESLTSNPRVREHPRLIREVPTTPAPRPVYPQQPTFKPHVRFRADCARSTPNRCYEAEGSGFMLLRSFHRR